MVMLNQRKNEWLFSVWLSKFRTWAFDMVVDFFKFIDVVFSHSMKDYSQHKKIRRNRKFKNYQKRENIFCPPWVSTIGGWLKHWKVLELKIGIIQLRVPTCHFNHGTRGTQILLTHWRDFPWIFENFPLPKSKKSLIFICVFCNEKFVFPS